MASIQASVMASFVVAWVEIKDYLAGVGPGLGRPDRPSSCPFCDAQRVWYDGWRIVFCAMLADGTVHRFDDGLPLQRVECPACSISWTLRPPFLYPHRSYALDVVEAATLEYLRHPEATYVAVGVTYKCSPRSVWRWVGWLAGLVAPAAVLAEAEQQHSSGESAALIPREVPQHHFKAYSEGRAQVLLLAFQTLCALGVWARALVVPPADASPLRVYLNNRFRTCCEVRLLVPGEQKSSPPLLVARMAPVHVQKPP